MFYVIAAFDPFMQAGDISNPPTLIQQLAPDNRFQQSLHLGPINW